MRISIKHYVKHNKKMVFFITTLLVFIYFLSTLSPLSINAESTKTFVHDNADLLSKSEANDLEDLLKQYSNKHNIDVVVLTVTSLDGKTDRRFLEDYVDNAIDSGAYSEDITILQFDTDSRYCTIQAYGTSEHIINDDNIEYILDVVAPQIRDHNYYEAFRDFAKGVNHYYSNQRFEFGREPIYLKTWFQLIAALVIGGVVVGSMAYNSQGKNTVNNHTYLDEQHSGIVAKRDIYLRTSVSKVRKPTNNNSGGGGRSSGGGGRSSGGRSHSGGSRKC